MLIRALYLILLSAQTALAEVPRVVADIPPVQGLVAAVMDGLGEPKPILPPGADPHGYAMRPSEAAALESADLVVWVGAGLTPWLAKPLDTLAGNSARLELLAVDGTRLIPVEDGHDDHGHGEIDPHAWLDPDNAVLWLEAIAAALSELDPGNSEIYRENADRTARAIRARIDDLEAIRFDDALPYAVYHAAYRYFETRFGLSHAFAIVEAEGQDPGPRRIAGLRQAVRDADVSWLIVQPTETAQLAETVFEGQPLEYCPIDPFGADIAPGPHHYARFLGELGSGFKDCILP